MSVGDEDEEEVMSELEESLEDDEGEGMERGNLMGGKKGAPEGPQQTRVLGGVIKGKEEKRHEPSYPLSPYKDGGDEEEQEYSTSFYPNDSGLNQSTVSFRSKLSTRSNKSKNKPSKDEDDYDAYSSSFEEEPSDIHDAYSGDFDNEYSFSMSGKRVETPKKALSVQIQIPQSSTTRTNQPNGAVAAATAPVLLPSVEIQTLQAELSLQKLSKEIVHLRNQQRESLRARRMEVLDKKKRAQARRESYLREMSELQKQLRESHETKQKLEENLQMKDQKLTIVETNSELLSGQNQEMNELIQNLQKEIAEARKSYKELQEKNEEIEKVKRDEKERWNAEKEVLRNQKLSCELQIEVLTRSNEKNEQRIANERETLPGHYQTILQERLTYVSYLEESLLKREESLKIEQQRNNMILETMKNEIRSDWEKREVMLRMELEQEREALQKEKALQFHELSQTEIQITSQKNQMEILSHELKRKENQLLEKEREIERESVKTQLTKEGLKPMNDLYHSEKERLRELKEDLRQQEEELSYREERISRREHDLRKREIEIERVLYVDIEDEKQKLRERDRQRAEYVRAIERNSEILEKEKDKIYRCSLELKRQYDVIQSGYRKWKKAMRSVTLRGGGRLGNGTGKNFFGSSRQDDSSVDEMQIFEIDEEVNWSDIIGDIREEIHLLDMGSEVEVEVESVDENDGPHLLRIKNQDVGYLDRDTNGKNEKKRVTSKLNQREAMVIERIRGKSATHRNGDRESEDVLSILDDPMATRNCGGGGDVPEDSLEYSMISTSPLLDRDVPASRFRNGQDEFNHPREQLRKISSRRSQSADTSSVLLPVADSRGEILQIEQSRKSLCKRVDDEDDIAFKGRPSRYGDSLSTTIDLQITTEQMKSIAMRYKVM